MRPRVFPAEDNGNRQAALGVPRSFNEAAGIPRGRHQSSSIFFNACTLASMRPRVFPAEDIMMQADEAMPAIALQ